MKISGTEDMSATAFYTVHTVVYHPAPSRVPGLRKGAAAARAIAECKRLRLEVLFNQVPAGW